MDLTTAINRRARRTPEQMIADMQAKIAAIKSQAEQPTAAAPQSVPDRNVVRARAATPSVSAKQRRANLRTRPTTSNAARPSANEVTNSLQAEIRSCVDSFAEDIVELINRSTLDAVQRAFGEAASSRGDSTDNAPALNWSPTLALPRAPKPAVGNTLSFAAYERMAIERALAECNGHVLEAAVRLGLTKSSIYRRIQVLGIRKPSKGGTFEISAHDPFASSGEPVSLDAYERAALLRAIEQSAGNVLAAGRLLKAGKSTLYRRMAALGIPRKQHKSSSR